MLDRARAVWDNEIDRLELEVIRVERLLRGLVTTPAEPWVAPTAAGPVPEDLRDRAAELLARQRVAREALLVALDRAKQQMTYDDRDGETPGTPLEPVYLDREA